LIPWGTLSAELEREEEQEEEAAAAAAEEEEAIAEEAIVTTTITTAAATKVYEERILSTKNNTPVKTLHCNRPCPKFLQFEEIKSETKGTNKKNKSRRRNPSYFNSCF
jgi:hypothetical protein